MKMNKKIKITAFSLLGVAFLFFATLVIHIGIMVKNQKPLENATIQMARVDFSNSLDLQQAQVIEENIKNQKGVKDVFYNEKNHLLIYTFDNRINNSENIYNTSIKSAEFSSAPYFVSAEDAAKGCPVINSDSFYGQLTKVVSKIIN